MNKEVLVITPGDIEGIGPEVTAKAIYQLRAQLRNIEILIYGSTRPFEKYQSYFTGLQVAFLEPDSKKSSGYQSAISVKLATEFVLKDPRSRALVTGPISKERIQKAGFPFQGHTDFIAKLTKTKNVTMMLSNSLFRVALVTNHCSLKDVSKKITSKNIETTFQHLHDHLVFNLGLKQPKIAVLGLNPHSGENGIMGTEEKKVIIPCIKKLQKKFKIAVITGPHPADSFFAIEKRKAPHARHDGVIAMYHDQGLIPVKLSDFENSLNMTLGLPIIRTSVDHGTAFNIAGKNLADPGSMIYAIQNAIQFLKKRKST